MPDKSPITAERLREVLDYDPKTGLFTWRARMGSCSRMKEGDPAGTVCDGYIAICVDMVPYKAHRLAWLYMTGEWPPDKIDHRDLDKINNRWKNLREATDSENQHNSPRRRDNTSGAKGIDRKNNKWRARISINKKSVCVGHFDRLDDAIKARLDAAKRLHGEFARQ